MRELFSMTLESPPIKNPLTEDTGELTMPWLLYFNQTFNGDAGESWTPTFTSLTTVGSPTITGRFYRISQFLCYFNVLVTPGTNTSATAGTTYINNLPVTAFSNGVCLTVSNNLGGGLGMITASNNRVYVPSWTTVTTPLNILGIVEAQ